MSSVYSEERAEVLTADLPLARGEGTLVTFRPRTSVESVVLPSVASAAEPHPLYNASKRLTDVFIGSLFLVVATPLILLAALAVVLTTRSLPFYAQRRVGQSGREFTIVKLRTMVNGAHNDVPRSINETSGPTFKARHDPRITAVGRVLRKLSIDEMPQFANVVLGQMSLVGPRPALPYEVRRYSRVQARRLAVKPGITCIWQVSGRSNIPFRSWVAMDRIYIQRRSLPFDLGLLVRTPWAVVSMKGAW